MNDKTVIDFLLFSCVGITLDDDKDVIIKQIVNRAYRDASSHVLSVKDESINCKSDAKDIVINFLNEIVKNDFRKTHNEKATELVDKFNGKTNDGYEFTYGVAQKWLNMSVKYLLLVYKLLDNYNKNHELFLHYKDCIISIEQNCDIPIDDFILEAVSQTERKKRKIDDGLFLEIAPKNGNDLVYYTSGKYLSWSNYNSSCDEWDKGNDNYHALQKQIKKKIILKENESVLDWENRVWINVAKNRNK